MTASAVDALAVLFNALSVDVTTPRRIEARFWSRKLGKVWHYSDQTPQGTLAGCAAYYGGRAPSVAEFDHWLERELKAARVRDDDTLHLPSPSPYRKRWGDWPSAGALRLHPEQLAGRLDPTR